MKPDDVDTVPAPAGQAPVRTIRVGWVAGRETLERFGPMLKPLAIGLMDEMVALTAFCPDRADVGELPSPPVEVVCYRPIRRPGLFRRRLEALAGQVRSRKIELLHGLDGDAADLTRRLARLAQVNCVLSSHALGDAGRLGRLDDRVAAVIASSQPIRRELLRRRVAVDRKVHLIRPGVYQVSQPTCFSDPSRSVAVVAGGTFGSLEGVGAVLSSFAELRIRKYDCAFFVIGGGPAERRGRSLAERLKLQHDVTFADRRPARRLPGILKGADIYISASRGRCIDLDALLAMSAGAVVLAGRGGPGDFLADGQTALLFDRNNSAEITMKLTGLLDDQASARSLAESALELLRDRHTPAGMVERHARIYRHAVDMPTGEDG